MGFCGWGCYTEGVADRVAEYCDTIDAMENGRVTYGNTVMERDTGTISTCC